MPSRRTVVRTAVWAVPAVTVVAAAPAMATTTTKANLVFYTWTAYNDGYVGPQPTTVSAQVKLGLQYAASAPSVTSILVVERTTAAKDSLPNLIYSAVATSPTANTATSSRIGTF